MSTKELVEIVQRLRQEIQRLLSYTLWGVTHDNIGGVAALPEVVADEIETSLPQLSQIREGHAGTENVLVLRDTLAERLQYTGEVFLWPSRRRQYTRAGSASDTHRCVVKETQLNAPLIRQLVDEDFVMLDAV